jgi:predicted acyl esterase
MATTAVQEGFFHALKPNNKTSDATAMTFVLQGGGPDESTTAGTTPSRNLKKFRFANNTSVTWQNVSGSYSQVKVKTTDGTTSRTFCTLPLTSGGTKTTTSPSGTDVELTAATLTVNSTGAAELLATSANTKTALDVTLVNDEDGGSPTQLTATNETGITYSVDEVNETMTVVGAGTVSFTSPTITKTARTDVDGVRCETGGGSRQIVQGQFSPTTALSFTTNATVSLTNYKITFT